MTTIDPRTIKQLLELQMLGKSGLLSSTATADEGNGFAEVLGMLLSTTADSADAGTMAAGAQAPFLPETTRLPLAYGFSAAPVRYAEDATRAEETSRRTAFEPIIQAASRRFGVEASLIKSVIAAESSYNANAVSHAGAKGLMQLMDATGRAMGVSDPFDPAQNIEGGTRYLSRLLLKYGGNEMMALAAYNAGPSRIDRLGVANDRELADKLHLLPEETQRYVRKVLEMKSDYEAEA